MDMVKVRLVDMANEMRAQRAAKCMYPSGWRDKKGFAELLDRLLNLCDSSVSLETTNRSRDDGQA